MASCCEFVATLGCGERVIQTESAGIGTFRVLSCCTQFRLCFTRKAIRQKCMA